MRELAIVFVSCIIAITVVDLARLGFRRMRAAGLRVDRLADPTRCPRCHQPYEAYDDVVSPHECGRAEW